MFKKVLLVVAVLTLITLTMGYLFRAELSMALIATQIKPQTDFDPALAPAAPDYSTADAWAALPDQYKELMNKAVEEGYAALEKAVAKGLFARAAKQPVTVPEDLDVPDTAYRDGQIANLAAAMLREHPARFDGRVATYDPQSSGVGYFLISQDSSQSDSFWRLAEVM